MPVDKFGRMSDTKTTDSGVSLTYINNNYLRSDGGTPLTGSLDMKGNIIYNVAEPVNPQDVATKVYVDNTKGSGVIGRKIGDAVSIKENMDFMGKQKIKNLPGPVNDHDAATKEYVDTKTELGNIDMEGKFTVLNVKPPINDNHITDKKYVDENAAFVFRNNEYYAKGNINLRNAKLGGLREPTQDGEASTKKYVDDSLANHFIDGNDNIVFGRDVDMEGNKIFALPEPDQDSDPATKKYVDDLQNQYIDKRGNLKFGRNINLDNKRIFALKDPKKDYEATNKKYVDDSITKRLQEEKDKFLPKDPATKEYIDEAIKQVAGGDILVSKEGVFIKANGHYRATAPIDIDNHKMENLPEPLEDGDAVNKKYVDGVVEDLTLKQGLIRENGGFNLVDSYINMNFNNIRNVGYPKHTEDAVPRSFVDDMVKEVEEKINKRKHLITVSTYYCGDLIKGEYQFPFGGNTCKFSGFLMPRSGRIKEIEIRFIGSFKAIPEGVSKEIRDKLITEAFSEVENEGLDVNNINDFRTMLRILYLNGNLFSIILFEKLNYVGIPVGNILSTYKCHDILGIDDDINTFKRNCRFDVDLTNYPLSKGEVINIKTEIERNVKSDWSFLFTFLIELDPLDD